jgi:hypothetical protein
MRLLDLVLGVGADRLDGCEIAVRVLAVTGFEPQHFAQSATAARDLPNRCSKAC